MAVMTLLVAGLTGVAVCLPRPSFAGLASHDPRETP